MGFADHFITFLDYRTKLKFPSIPRKKSVMYDNGKNFAMKYMDIVDQFQK